MTFIIEFIVGVFVFKCILSTLMNLFGFSFKYYEKLAWNNSDGKHSVANMVTSVVLIPVCWAIGHYYAVPTIVSIIVG